MSEQDKRLIDSLVKCVAQHSINKACGRLTKIFILQLNVIVVIFIRNLIKFNVIIFLKKDTN